MKIATLAGGCFWCLETIYRDLEGVENVVSGYSGGSVDDPTYEEVCSGNTGHAEVVQLHYNPSTVTFKEILEIFFFIHDPTTLNRQGNDIGTQYRSAVFYHDDEQAEITRSFIDELTKQAVYQDSIVTEVVKFEKFYAAEDYHQDYYNRNPNQGYCNAVITPKVAKFRKKYFAKLKYKK